jgi:hypothetical protein
LGNVVIRLKNNPKSIKKIVNTLRDKRSDLSTLRRTTWIIAREYSEKFSDDPIYEFMNAVSSYFPGGDFECDPSDSTRVIDLLDR